jgi:shikimate kinase
MPLFLWGNIFLTGFMGSGKSTAGKKLAKLLRLKFIDLDYYIEQREKLTVQSLFENFGEQAFRKIEQSCLIEILKSEKQAVIALGGGTICFENNLNKIKENGLLIFIDLPATALAQRLETSKVKRPLIKDLKGEELVTFVVNKLNERKAFYDQAHIAVSGLSLTPQLLRQIISDYKK